MRAIWAALVAAVALLAADASVGSSAPQVVSYRLTFTGSGTATAGFPPTASNTTVYTTSIDWKLIYDVTIDSSLGQPDLPWTPLPGSRVEGSSTGVAAPGGTPIDDGCDHISLSLDPNQWGVVYRTRTVRKIVLGLYVPGFKGPGELVAVSPGTCSNPFPSGAGCPDVLSLVAPGVTLDTSRKTQSWTLFRRCDVPNESQTEHWAGKVTATQHPPPLHFDGHTSQHLPISFELKDGTVSDLVAEDKGTCANGKTSRSRLAVRAARLGAHGRFHVAYSTNAGAYHVQLTGRITGTRASGVLSTTSRFNAFSGTLDPTGTVRCTATAVRWTAVGFASATG